MAINKENYPEYFLDYFEGRLSDADKAELFVFLDRNAALREEFEAFDPLPLEPETTNFPDHASLKRGQVTPSNYDWYFAAYTEGDLSREDQEAVERFVLSHPDKERELRMMQAAFLSPDDAVMFPAKAALKRHLMAHSLWYYVSAAAAVLLVAGLFFMWEPDQATTTFVVDVPTVEEAVGPEGDAGTPSPPTIPAQQLAAREEAREDASRSSVSATTNRPGPDARAPISESSNDNRLIQQQMAGSTHADIPSLQAIPVTKMAALPRHTMASKPAVIEYKTEFAYWSPASMPAEYYVLDEYDRLPQMEPEPTTLTRLAFSSLQNNVAFDLRKVEEHIYQGRIPLLELATRGLTELGAATTSALGIEREVDENGRLLAVKAGNLFEARRSRR